MNLFLFLIFTFKLIFVFRLNVFYLHVLVDVSLIIVFVVVDFIGEQLLFALMVLFIDFIGIQMFNVVLFEYVECFGIQQLGNVLVQIEVPGSAIVHVFEVGACLQQSDQVLMVHRWDYSLDSFLHAAPDCRRIRITHFMLFKRHSHLLTHFLETLSKHNGNLSEY